MLKYRLTANLNGQRRPMVPVIRQMAADKAGQLIRDASDYGDELEAATHIAYNHQILLKKAETDIDHFVARRVARLCAAHILQNYGSVKASPVLEEMRRRGKYSPSV